MNAYAEIRDGEEIPLSEVAERPEPPPRLGLVSRVRCLLLAAIPLAAFIYLLATAKLAVVLVTVGALLALLVLLIAASFYVLDNAG